MMSIIAAMTANAIRMTGIAVTVVVTALILLITVLLYRRALEEERATAPAQETAPDEETEQPEETAQTDETEREYEEQAEEQDVEAEQQNVAQEQQPQREEQTAENDEKSEVSEEKEVEREGIIEETPAEEQAASVVEETEEEYPSFIQKYLEKLDGQDKELFEQIVLNNAEELSTRVKEPVSQYTSEKEFVTDFFRSSAKYAKRIPIAVTEMLYKRNAKYIETDKERSKAMRKMIAAYYARRKEENTLGKCEKLCKQDTEYWISTGEIEGKALPPLKKLAVMCVAQKRYDEALEWCDKAIEHNIIDAKGVGYEARKEKIKVKKEKYETRMAKQKAKQAKQREKQKISEKEGK